MRREEKIYSSLNSISEIENKVFWAYISEDEAEELKNTSSVVISLTDRETARTFSGLVPVRSTYALDIRSGTAIDCEMIMDKIITSLDNSLSDYTIVGLIYDPDLERVRMTSTLQIIE